MNSGEVSPQADIPFFEKAPVWVLFIPAIAAPDISF
jgi:hypothetical protein